MKRSSKDFQTLLGIGAVGGLSDGKLLEQFVAHRDEAVFEALLIRHGPMVWGVCRRILRDPNDAEDAFQATFLVLVRRASSIARREMIANWLYAVAYKTAVRARAVASRRRAREQQVPEMPEPEAVTDEPRDNLPALLDAELSRLPEKYRIPIILCELEGKTQKEAAKLLGWPAGTVSSRLSRGKAMLAGRLARRGMPLSVGALTVFLSQEATSASLPARLIGATAQAASLFAVGGTTGVVPAKVANLTTEVLKMMFLSKLKIVAPLILMALIGTGFIGYEVGAVGAVQQRQRQQDKAEAPKPAQNPAAQAEPPAPPKWAHLTSDAGFESWVRLEDGRNLWKSEEYAGVRDPASGTELNYYGSKNYYGSNGPVVRRPDIVWMNDDGRRDVGFALDRAGVKPLDEAEIERRMTEEGRRVEGGNFASEAEVVDLNGRRCLRIDMSRPDSLGKLRLSEQTWYDIETRRPIQRKSILQLADQEKYKREFSTTAITYLDTGPADIYAMGVPAATPIVDEATLNKVEIPPQLQKAFDGAAQAIERLPRSLRIVEDGDTGLRLTYWSAPEGYLESRAAFVRDHNHQGIYNSGTPKLFFADHQGSSEVEIPRNLRTRPGNDLPADALAAWLPVDRSVNVHLNDGTMSYNLTRLTGGTDGTREVRVHVLQGSSFNDFPKPIEETWGFAFDNRRNLEFVPPEPGTPEEWVAIKVEYPQIRELYYADPEHGYATARMVEWSGLDGARMRFRTESKALRWTQLPGGVWYVSEWEQLHHLDEFDASGKPEANQQADYTTIRRVVITPMAPEQFPAGIFDGEKFLEAARKEGAKIQVD